MKTAWLRAYGRLRPVMAISRIVNSLILVYISLHT